MCSSESQARSRIKTLPGASILLDTCDATHVKNLLQEKMAVKLASIIFASSWIRHIQVGKCIYINLIRVSTGTQVFL